MMSPKHNTDATTVVNYAFTNAVIGWNLNILIGICLVIFPAST